MTRSSGSVPEYRTRSRPRPASFASTSSMARAAAGMVIQSRFSRTRRLSSTCGIRLQVAREVGERAPRFRHHPQHVERGDDAVARVEEVREDDVAGLFTAERQVVAQQLLHDVLVAHRAAHQPDAEVAQRHLEAEVAHHGGDDGVAAQPPRRLHLLGAHQQDGIAVDDAPGGIDEDRPVAVAVERHAQVAALVDHRPRQALGMRGPALEVDVAPVGLAANRGDVEPEAPQQRRRHLVGGAVRAVDGDAPGVGRERPAEGAPRVGEVRGGFVDHRHGRARRRRAPATRRRP